MVGIEGATVVDRLPLIEAKTLPLPPRLPPRPRSETLPRPPRLPSNPPLPRPWVGAICTSVFGVDTSLAFERDFSFVFFLTSANRDTFSITGSRRQQLYQLPTSIKSRNDTFCDSLNGAL